MKRAYADIPEGQVHYRTEGKGEPLLLLHQVPLSSEEFALMIPILAKKYRVIAMDTLGYGSSDRPPRKYLIEDYARSVVSFLDALGVKKTNIAAHHTGASVAVELAAAYPERVDKLVLSGCPVFRDQTVRDMLMKDETYQPPQIKPDGSHIMRMWDVAKSYWPQISPEILTKVVSDNLRAGVYAEDAHQAVFRYPVEQRLPLIKAPTLLLSGSKDLFIKRLEPTGKMIPRCRTKAIDGGTVWICFEMAQQLSDAILEFMANPAV